MPSIPTLPQTIKTFNFESFLSQARRKWHEQQEAFERQRREHEIQMIAMEAAEVDRRSEEVRRVG